MPHLARRLGLFDATMIVMGGIIGAGIFVNPYVVARQLHTPFLILLAWALGGAIALAGALVYAELASILPAAGGQYVYLREAWHPAVAFLYGWTLLLIVQSGGMAAVAVTFARYALELTGGAMPELALATATLAALTLINCLGVRAGGTTQNLLMVLKVAAIVMLVVAGFALAGPAPSDHRLPDRPPTPSLLLAIGAAMTPVMFAFGGWQTASFVAAEMMEPRRDLGRGLLLGMSGVVAIYLAVNLVSLHVLGAAGLAQTTTPASAVMRAAMGERGAQLIAFGIALSTLGFLSQGMLTAPRVYFAMASDGVFFRSVARIHPRTHVPVIAIVLQGAFATLIAWSGTYERILGYVVSADFIFFGLTGLAVFVFRRRGTGAETRPFRTPLHPVTTALFVAACWLVVIATVLDAPRESLAGFAIIAAGLPVYWVWARKVRERTMNDER